MSNQFVATTITLAAVVAASSLTPPPANRPGHGLQNLLAPTTLPQCSTNARWKQGKRSIRPVILMASRTWEESGVTRQQVRTRTSKNIPGCLTIPGGQVRSLTRPMGKSPMRAWADARRKEHPQRYIHHNAACFLSGVPETMYMTGPYQFLQTPGYLVILVTNVHAYRIIPLDERPPVGESIRLWNGDSSGHWEGNTLVIETTNQNGKPWLDQRGRFYTEEAHVVERLTLIDLNTLHYQATIDDPNVYTSPFTIALAYRRSTEEGYEMLIEACYENNEAFLDVYRTLGFAVYPGISVEEAREAMEAEQ